MRSYTLGSELLLYVGEDDTAIALNSSALAIWSLVDGDRTVAEIVEVIADEASVSGEDILKDVLEALDDFVELGVMTLTAPGPPS